MAVIKMFQNTLDKIKNRFIITHKGTIWKLLKVANNVVSLLHPGAKGSVVTIARIVTTTFTIPVDIMHLEWKLPGTAFHNLHLTHFTLDPILLI
jgi:hypothetical protein